MTGHPNGDRQFLRCGHTLQSTPRNSAAFPAEFSTFAEGSGMTVADRAGAAARCAAISVIRREHRLGCLIQVRVRAAKSINSALGCGNIRDTGYAARPVATAHLRKTRMVKVGVHYVVRHRAAYVGRQHIKNHPAVAS